jgi:hypothetical protein
MAVIGTDGGKLLPHEPYRTEDCVTIGNNFATMDDPRLGGFNSKSRHKRLASSSRISARKFLRTRNDVLPWKSPNVTSV